MSEFEIGMKVRRSADHKDLALVIGIHAEWLWVCDGLQRRFTTPAHIWEPIPTTIPVMLEVEVVERAINRTWDVGDALATHNAYCAALAKHRGESHE